MVEFCWFYFSVLFKKADPKYEIQPPEKLYANPFQIYIWPFRIFCDCFLKHIATCWPSASWYVAQAWWLRSWDILVSSSPVSFPLRPSWYRVTLSKKRPSFIPPVMIITSGDIWIVQWNEPCRGPHSSPTKIGPGLKEILIFVNFLSY